MPFVAAHGKLPDHTNRKILSSARPLTWTPSVEHSPFMAWVMSRKIKIHRINVCPQLGGKAEYSAGIIY